MSFQMLQSDVEAVLESYNVEKYDIENIMVIMDDDEVSRVSSETDDEVQQTEIAYDEIAKQLYLQGYISKQQVQEYGNIAILG